MVRIPARPADGGAVLRPVLLGVGSEHVLHHLHQQRLVGNPRRQWWRSAHRSPIRDGSHRLAGIDEQLLIGHRHVDLAVGRLERAVGCGARNGRCRRAWAGRRRSDSTNPCCRGTRAKRCHRARDRCAGPWRCRRAGKVERGIDRGHRMDLRHGVDDGDGMPHALAVGLAVDASSCPTRPAARDRSPARSLSGPVWP